MSSIFQAIQFVAALSLLALTGVAQTSTSQISGTVRDASGSVVPAAAVTLTNEATGVVQRQNSTAAGVYVFPAINVGTYSVRVEAKGFKSLPGLVTSRR